MKREKMKALLCCVACTPGWGAEFGMGWNFAHAVSSFCEAHVIVAEEARRRLETYCSQHREQTKNLHFYYVSGHTKTKWWENAAERYVPSLYFYYKYRTVLQQVSDIAIELDKAENFDIVHQVTLAGFRMPGYLWRLGKPLLWGPTGGMDNAPYRLIVSLRLIDVVGYTLRNIINTYQKHIGYAAKVYSSRAAYILTSTHEGEREVRSIWKRPGEYMCEIGTAEASELNALSCSHRPGEPLRLCWAGIVNNQRKNLPLLFKALEYCDSPVDGVHKYLMREREIPLIFSL